MENPDFADFQDRLLTASRAAFESVQKEHPDECFYAFALYHEPLWGYIAPTSNTLEGLERKADIYKQDRHGLGYAQMSMEELQINLRWIPGDWDYHLREEDVFSPVQQWLDNYDVLDLKLDDKDFEKYNQRMIAICRNTLKTLDSEGLFGTGEHRQRVMLNIMMGDQDRSWLSHAKALNPPTVYEKWLDELRAADLL